MDAVYGITEGLGVGAGARRDVDEDLDIDALCAAVVKWLKL